MGKLFRGAENKNRTIKIAFSMERKVLIWTDYEHNFP